MLRLSNLDTYSLRGTRAKVAFAHDLTMAALSFLIALYLRVGGDFNYFTLEFIVQATIGYTVIAGMVLWTMRLYAGVWRYASVEDFLAIIKAVSVICLVYFVAMFLVSRLELIPRSALPINWLVLLALLGGPRFMYRLFKDRRAHDAAERDGERRIPVLLIGAGDAAELFIRAINRARQSAWHAIGLIDEKGDRIGRNIHGVHVLGGINDIPSIIDRMSREGRKPQRLIVTRSEIEGEEVQRLLLISEKLGISLARMPQLDDFRENVKTAPEIRPINIEDLLGRPQATLDRDSMAELIGGRRVLVTGAGGTVGSELCRQVAAFGPASMALIDNSEYQLYAIDLEISENAPSLPRRAVLADVRDAKRIGRVFEEERPELIFHAAALKHVPMVERHPDEGALTHVIGTKVVADACSSIGAKAMVLISTDKAVNPSSMMGATKRVAESYCQALDLHEATLGDNRTHFLTVRFGNVLGSTGSVVPLFQRQLAAGGPLTVTHPDMTRYFMTVREAVELVLQSSVQGVADGAEQGKIYVLDMGEPVKIIDLARQIILLAGRQPDIDVKIQITGPRPGEKLFEEILHASEELVPTNHPGILLAAPRATDLNLLARIIEELAAAARNGDRDGAREIVHRLVPEFKPPDDGNNRDTNTQSAASE
ncbi:MAG: nucleoside-diphosphate sugar epimerase/dehydratase [Pseudomonadota bacterium]|nr:nucleoside-diphosphate sugar epimerase/dehydratase [Pseudomonadota bacterium]